jgi:hypothetical protein
MSSKAGRRPVSFLLYCSAHSLDEVLVPVLPFQSFLELRRKRRQKLGMTGSEQSLGVGGAKPDRIAGAAAEQGTAKVALKALYLRPRCVIEVPASLGQLLDGVGIDARRSLRNTRTSADDFGVHNELPIRAGKCGNVSARLLRRAGVFQDHATSNPGPATTGAFAADACD